MSSTVSKALRARVLDACDYRCVYCGRSWEDVTLTVDHVRPRAKGGKNIGGNLVAACQRCNSSKGAKWE